MRTGRMMEMNTLNLANSGNTFLSLKCAKTPSGTDRFVRQGRRPGSVKIGEGHEASDAWGET